MTDVTASADRPRVSIEEVLGEPQLRQAREQLRLIDSDLETARFLRAGLDPETVAQRTGKPLLDVRSVQHILDEGRETRPLTPEELGYRRAVGQISTAEMMLRLRAWPYNSQEVLGCHRGAWEDVDYLHRSGFLTDAEYAELRAITDPMPRPEDVDDV